LAGQKQRTSDVYSFAENGGCQPVVGADSAKGNQMRRFSATGVGQYKFELSDFIAAVNTARQIISFDPEMIISKPGKRLD
jgi:hypothetical protein